VDTQISRLGGPNFHEIPINAPIAQVHNNQRDGMHRQAIHRGRVAYEPNSLGGGCPFQAGKVGFVSTPEPMEADSHKVRGKPERFADHYTQATLFWNSQTPTEKAHIVNAFRFELSRVQTPAVRRRMVSGLRNVAAELAEAVAAGLGMTDLPEAMPKVLQKDITPEITKSPALSLFSRPGDGTLHGRRVALLVADGVDATYLGGVAEALLAAGAVPRYVAPRLGTVASGVGDPIEADVSVEATPSVLYDAVVIGDGAQAVQLMATDGRIVEFIKDQYRHCKPMLVVGAASGLLEKAGVPPTLPSGKPDPGVILQRGGGSEAIAAFVDAIARHRHFERETDPPIA
jgi:catalase